MTRRREGQHWERRAESFLLRQGLTIVERNYNCRVGEIDLIMYDHSSLVFVTEMGQKVSPAKNNSEYQELQRTIFPATSDWPTYRADLM
jgi:putative endonuclease